MDIEFVVGQKVWAPELQKEGVVHQTDYGYERSCYPILVKFDNGKRTYTTDGYRLQSHREDHPEWKLRISQLTIEYALTL